MRRSRKGTAAIELALTLPVFLFFMVCLYQYCHAQMTLSLLRSGCRIAARWGSMDGATSDEAIERVRAVIGAGVPLADVTITVKDASVFDSDGPYPKTMAQYDALPDLELQNAEERQMFVVRASVRFQDIVVLNFPFLQNITLVGQAVMRHE